MRAFSALMMLMLAVLPAAAQITTGTVTGTVRDAQGGVIPGATVVLISEARGTRSAPVTTTETGDYVFPNTTPDTYAVEVTMPGFKTLRRGGVSVSGGDRIAVQPLTIEVGGTSETINVTATAPLIQSQSGERSYTVSTTEVENLPISGNNGRNFASFATLTPGVFGGGGTQSGQQASRIGGGGQNNLMMDGVSVMDTGNNGQLLSLNPDAIAEVKVIASGYAAEYGRSSGLQISAVTKGGTNQFRGSVYDIKRNSDWNENSWANEKNGLPKNVSKQDDWGYTIGGPIGKPGGDNRLFFFHAMEFRPRETGNQTRRFRLPTALERQGDFSQSRDINGALFNLIRDPATGLECTASNTAGCFQDGGVLGRIPQDRLYGTGLAILSMYPMPNVNQTTGLNYNYSIQSPVLKTLAYQPTGRVDFQFTQNLRLTAKYNGQNGNSGRVPNIGTNANGPGSIPGFNDTLNMFPWIHAFATTVNYSLGPTTFLEGTYGVSQNRLGTPIITENANRFNVGLGGIPQLFPNAGKVDPRYYEYTVLEAMNAPFFVNGEIQLPPQFRWGNRIGNAGNNDAPSPPDLAFPGFLNINKTQDISISLTKIMGRHSAKAGFYYNHSYKAQNSGQSAGGLGTINFGNDPNNPLDSGFGFANAALGVFTSYNQTEKFIEGSFLYNNIEFYAQDNWKMTPRLTVDYGLRFTHQQPQYDQFGQTSNFFPEQWSRANAPLLYLPGCVAANPCSGNNRQAIDPRTGALLGPGSAAVIGQAVLGTGSTTNGIRVAGDGISEKNYTWPTLAVAPRAGFAYDVTGAQKIVVRGSTGLFFDRPDGNTVFGTVQNPPITSGTTVRNGTLQTLNSGLRAGGVPNLQNYRYENDSLPSDIQWSTGVQVALPWSSAIDVAYVGHHAYNILFGEQNGNNVNLNAIDIGTAFPAASGIQDPTQPSGTSLPAELLRPFRGYGNINQQWQEATRTFHSIQSSFTRRFRGGLSAQLNWTLSLKDTGTQGIARVLTHNPDGSFQISPDQPLYDELLKDQGLRRHLFKGDFVWDMPDLRASAGGARVIGALLNDWQLSGIFTGGTGRPYDVGYSYQGGIGNQQLTGSPDYGARVRIIGDPGSGCSDNQYQQFNTAAFAGPQVGSKGLESGRNYLNGCADHRIDLALARSIRLGGARQIQVRVEAFNALNTVIINNRQTQLQLNNPNDPTVRNAQFNADGSIATGRALPNNAGFGAATAAEDMRSFQLQLRFQF